MVGAVVFGGAVKQGKAGFPTFSGKSSAGQKVLRPCGCDCFQIHGASDESWNPLQNSLRCGRQGLSGSHGWRNV